jgi:tetratricopeptide (TPR) repeat protein
MDVHYVDDAVQQAGYYDSRRKPTAPPAGAATMPSTGMYRGQKLKMPVSLFGRKTTSTSSTGANAQVPQPGTPAAAMNPNARGQVALRANPAAPNRPMPPAARSSAYNGSHLGDTRPMPPAPQRQLASPAAAKNMPAVRGARPNVSSPAVPNSSTTAPWSNAPPAPPAARPVAAPTRQAVQAPQVADQLIAQAHELSTRAETEEDYTHIIEMCRRALASQPSEATSQFAKNLLAWSFNRRGQLKAEACQEKTAVLDFNEAIRMDASCWRALHNRGVLLAQDGNFDKAFDDFSRTIELNPEFAKAYSNRAALFMVANKLDAALADYDHAIELDPKLAVAHRGCGRVCQLLGKTDEAVSHYNTAVELAPNDAYAATCRADLLTDVGRYSEAVAEYDRAIEIDPNSTQAQGGSAWLLATCPDSSVRDPELAIERAQTAITHGGESDAAAYDTLGAAQASAGDFEAAMSSVRKAIDLAPAEERESYNARLSLYQQAKPYRISPMDFDTEQASYEATDGPEGVSP